MKNESAVNAEPQCIQRASSLVDILTQSEAVQAARKAELDALQDAALLAGKDEHPDLAAERAADFARIETLLRMASDGHLNARRLANRVASEISPLLVAIDHRISDGNRRNLEAAREYAGKKLAGFFDAQHLPAAVLLSEVFLREVAFASNRQPAASYFIDSLGIGKDGKEIIECRSLGGLLNVYNRQKATAEAIEAHAAELARALK
jgi:hypothetical protein